LLEPTASADGGLKALSFGLENHAWNPYVGIREVDKVRIVGLLVNSRR
jgi:hypothetical protein